MYFIFYFLVIVAEQKSSNWLQVIKQEQRFSKPQLFTFIFKLIFCFMLVIGADEKLKEDGKSSFCCYLKI